MTMDDMPPQPPTEIFKALSDPVRWSIIVQMASVDELACITLEDTLPVSKPTISYHTKILHHAGLINVRKSGRNYYYSLRRDVLHKLLDDLWELAPMPRPVVAKEDGQVAMGRGQKRADSHSAARKRRASPAREAVEEAVVLTW
jgi:DNA-binding transcriptional ArsR family regulator